MTDLKKRGFFGKLAGLVGGVAVAPILPAEAQEAKPAEVVEKIVYVPTHPALKYSVTTTYVTPDFKCVSTGHTDRTLDFDDLSTGSNEDEEEE